MESLLPSQKIYLYFKLLRTAPKRVVLMSPKSNEIELYKKHIEEAKLYLPNIAPFSKVLDLGSGAGFPGIPLAIWMKDTQFFLLDKKVVHTKFLEDVKNSLHLKNVTIINMDARLLYRTNFIFDTVVARAVNRIETVLSYVKSNIKSGGLVVLGKKKDIEKELKSIVEPFKLEELRETPFGFIVVIKKL